MKPIHLLMISLDNSLLNPDSAAYQRHLAYAKHFKQLSILLLTRKIEKPFKKDTLLIIPGLQPISMKDVDCISAQDPLLTGLLGVILKYLFHKKLNIQLHVDFFGPWQTFNIKHRMLFFLFKIVIPHADSVRVVSLKIKHDIERCFPHLSKKISVIPIAVNTRNFFKKAELKNNLIRFITVGRLVPEKNVTLLIEAFSIIHQKFPQTTLTIIGDGPERKKLQELAYTTLSNPPPNLGGGRGEVLPGLKREARSVVFTGHLPQRELAKKYHRSDIYLHTSHYEGFGMVFVEAFAAGLPVISTSNASVGDLLQPGKNCLIAPSTSHAYADVVIKLIKKPQAAYELAHDGQKHVLAEYDSLKLSKKWIDSLYATIN